MIEKVTISLIKADIGSLAGHHTVHPKQIEVAQNLLAKIKKENKITDFYVFHGGDDLELLMPHRLSTDEMEYTTLPQVFEKFKD